MIYDNVRNKERYRTIPWLYALLDSVETYREPGTYPLEGENRAVVSAYATTKEDIGRMENHSLYIDVQYVASGRERIGVLDRSLCAETDPYNPAKDVEFLRAPAEKITVLHMTPGDFAVLYPGETHSPGVVDEVSSDVEKIVFKVKA